MLASLVTSLRDLALMLCQPASKRGTRRNHLALARYAELAETRVLLSSHSLTPVADGVVADRDLDGLFEFAESSSSSVTNRWFDFGGIGQERGVFEFDLGQFAPGSVITSAKLGMYVTSFTSDVTSGPTVAFSVKSGDGSVSGGDGDGTGTSAGSASISATGYREFSLTASAFASSVGGKVAVRVSNNALNGHWVSAASSEDASFADPVLIVDVAAPTLSVVVNPNTLHEDGSVSAVGTVTRTGDLSQALTVTLSSSDTTEVSVPASVVIPVGASSAPFAVAAVDDAILDGTQTAAITASAILSQGTTFSADTSFGTNGIAATRAYTAIQPSYAAVMPLADGKYLIASEISGGTSWQLLRYNANGSLDTTFGTNGIATTTIGATSSYPVPRVIVVQPDGKILVGGKASGGVGSAVLTRHNANGTIDTTFGNAGRADLANLGGWIEDIALRPDGRILLAVSFNGTSYFRVAGLTATGQFDSNFGIKTYTNINGLARAIELLNDGSFILAGGKFVAKFTEAGVIDTSYGVNGITNIGLPLPEFVDIFDAKLGPDGKLSLGMSRYNNATQTTNNTANMAALRLRANGAVDTTFGNGAIQSVDFNGMDDVPITMLLQSDGKILIGGYAEKAENNRDMAMTRFNVDGTLDTTFDGDGRFQQNVITYTGEMIASLAQQADGKLISLAGFSNDYRLLRYHSGTEYVAPESSTTVSVRDNENAPPVVDARTFQIEENVPTGTLLGQIVARDPDAGHLLTYSIDRSSLPGAFVIDAASGELLVGDGSLLNFEAVTRVTLTVTATDNGTPNESGSNTITINLTNVNEYPVVPQLQLFEIDENVANGTVVGTFVATDPDAGQTVTLQVTEESLAGAFAVNPSTGQITVADRTLLDFETVQSATLVVLASDNQTPPFFGNGGALINIRNVNEAPTVHSIPYTVYEHAATNTYVGQVLGTDPEFGTEFRYAILGSSHPGAVVVDGISGEIVVADGSQLNFEASPTITIDVQITDNGVPALSSVATLTIDLVDVNEAPTILNQTFSIAENTPAGTTVATLAASDVDAGQSLTYSITESSLSGAFAINSATGRITVADALLLDFESVTSAQLTVLVTDNGNPRMWESATITVNITNGNEAPVISDAAFSIREYLNSGLTVGNVVASDPDAGQTLRYSIVSQSVAEAFMIRMDTGEIIVWRSAVLDHETVGSVTVTVRATDSANPALSSTATVVVTITDVNESPVMGAQSFTIAEDAANGTVVGTIAGADVDRGQTLTWRISSSPVPGAFVVNAATGELTVADGSLLNFESRTSIELGVFLTDNGTPVLATVAPITINITNVNEAPTVSNRSFTIDENSVNDTAVGSAAGTDPDAGQSLSYAISSTTLPGAFVINASTGQVTVANQSLLNYEAVTSATLVVTTTDSGNPALQGSGTITINLRNLNEAPVVSDQAFAVDENTTNGTTVGTFTASDVDAGQSLQYMLTNSSHPGAFLMDTATGRITVGNVQLLNHESTSSISLSVSVSDNGNPSLTTSATVIVSINDVNETPVVGNQLFFIDENSINGTVLGTADGSDVDAGQSLTYSISASTKPGAFTINATTGQISVDNSALLDYESGTRITLTVAAEDNGLPSLSSSGVVTIELRNVNDAPTLADYAFSIDENALNGSLLGQVSGTDPDAGQSLSYAIAAASVPGVFTINAATGHITVLSNAQLNFEAVSEIVLTVTATDNGLPSLSDAGQITISLRDLNELPTLAAQTFSVNENSASGTVVGQVAASDVDAGQSLTYSIVSGNTAGAFAINAATGRITVANLAALDFETTPVFAFTVRVADSGSPSLSRDAVMTINLNNVNEAIAVGLDVVPGDATNTFRRTAKFEVVILSTASFNARNVLISSVRFGKLGTEDSIVRDKKGNRLYSYRDVNGDGRLDLVLQIDGSKTGLAVGDTLALFTGDLLDGTDLFGSSSVVVKR